MAPTSDGPNLNRICRQNSGCTPWTTLVNAGRTTASHRLQSSTQRRKLPCNRWLFNRPKEASRDSAALNCRFGSLFGWPQPQIIVLPRDGFRVSNPSANNVRRVGLHQLRFPGRSQVLKRLLPGDDSGAFYDPIELRSKILIRGSIASDNKDGTVCRLLLNLHQRLEQFRE